MSALTWMTEAATDELATMSTSWVARQYDRLAPDVDPDSEADQLVVAALSLVLADRRRAEVDQMSDTDILHALEPIADLRHPVSPSVSILRTALTDELVGRHPIARATEDAWVDGPDEGEEFERGPAVLVCAAVRAQLATP